MTKNKIFKRLNEEAKAAGLTNAEFVSKLDAAAAPHIGTAYAFGLITAAHTETFNKETVCRYIREWRRLNRIKVEQN